MSPCIWHLSILLLVKVYRYTREESEWKIDIAFRNCDVEDVNVECLLKEKPYF